jgi:hypothetical protein
MKFDFDDAYESKESRVGETKQNDWIDTTDSLEAVEAIRGWKNSLFAITLVALIATQIIFWLASAGVIRANNVEQQSPYDPGQINPPAADEATSPAEVKAAPVFRQEGAGLVEPNLPAIAKHKTLKNMLGFLEHISSDNFSLFITFINSVLILGAVLYCLTLLGSLQIAISGRLGGINHICRAFFLSLLFVILLLPWQKIFAGLVVGAVYGPKELLSSCVAVQSGDTFDQILYYLRFFVFWLVELMLLIFAHVRSMRWAKAILRRLEVI